MCPDSSAWNDLNQRVLELYKEEKYEEIINERRSRFGAAHPFFRASFIAVGEP
jgi:hypothetical protein